jgi:Protein of unknown function, DUF
MSMSAWSSSSATVFKVEVTEVNHATAARKRFGLPDRYGSCHTATVAADVLEGHGPAADVKRGSDGLVGSQTMTSTAVRPFERRRSGHPSAATAVLPACH